MCWTMLWLKRIRYEDGNNLKDLKQMSGGKKKKKKQANQAKNKSKQAKQYGKKEKIQLSEDAHPNIRGKLIH